MVGHTGVMDAAVKAVKAVDECVGRVVDAIVEEGRQVHHHRRPRQRRPDGRPRARQAPSRAHTTNPVPVIVIDPDLPQA